MIGCAPLPSAFITQMSLAPERRTKAICLPSGDHVGRAAFLATSFNLPPFAGT